MDAQLQPAAQCPSGAVPTPPVELEEIHRTRDWIKQTPKKVWAYCKSIRGSTQSLPLAQDQAIAVPIPVQPIAQAEATTDVTEDSQQITDAPGQLRSAQKLRSHEQEREYEGAQSMEIDEMELFERDIERWVYICVGKFLERNVSDEVPRFHLNLLPYTNDAFKGELRDRPFTGPRKHKKRSCYIAVQLNSPSKADAIKTRVQNELMRESFTDIRQGFEVRVFSAQNFGRKGLHGNDLGLTIADQPLMQIAFPGAQTTLCAARITLATGQGRMPSQPHVWTCGGLISVQDRIYALTVSHPLERTDQDDKDTSPDDEDPDQILHASVWRQLGRIATRDASSHPEDDEMDSDWMLIQVKKNMQLPNLISPDFFVRDRSTSHVKTPTDGRCRLLTSRGHMPGKIAQGTSCLVFGSTRIRALQVEILEPLVLGDSGSWVVDESDEPTIIGVVIAGADSTLDGATGPVAFVLRTTDIYTSLSQDMPSAEPRLLSYTENAILRRRNDKPEVDNLPGLCDLYAADIVSRFHQNIGLINPSHLITDDVSSVDSDLRPFLVLGQIFPCDESARQRLRATSPRGLWQWALHARGVSRRAIEIWNRLHEFERGENFLALLKAFVCSTKPVDVTQRYSLSNNLRETPSRPPYVAFRSAKSTRLVDAIFDIMTLGNPHTSPVSSSVVALIRNLLDHSDIRHSARPSLGLIDDLVRLAAVTPSLFPPYGERYRGVLPSADLACILAKASYAERHGCFFVYEGFFPSEVRHMLTLACRNRRLFAWYGNSSEFPVNKSSTARDKALFPRLFIDHQLEYNSPEFEMDSGNTGKLVRCPALYEHLYDVDQDSTVGALGNGFPYTGRVPTAIRKPRDFPSEEQLIQYGRGTDNQSRSANETESSTYINIGQHSRVHYVRHVHNYYSTATADSGRDAQTSHQVVSEEEDEQ